MLQCHMKPLKKMTCMDRDLSLDNVCTVIEMRQSHALLKSPTSKYLPITCWI